MVNYREILRLNSLNYTQRQIAASVHSSRNTIREVLESATKAGIEWLECYHKSAVPNCKEMR